jgi:RHS repeat-associated protein
MGLPYDRAGRIRAKGPTLATAMTYDYSDQLTPDHAPGAVTTGGVTTPFTYDDNGNMLTGLAGKIMTYDGENRPLSVTHLGKRTCYVYGVDGKRLKKVEGLPPTQDCTALPANTNATVYFGAVEVRNWLVAGAEQVLTYPHPAVKLLNGTTPAVATYLHRDGLSSVRAITDAAGVKIESALYKPFGEQSEWVLPGNAAPETKGWIGTRYDADAGLQYLNARYYDPELSLFLQPDWFEVTKAGVGTNRFSYSFNDPVNKFDPGGNECIGLNGASDFCRRADLYHAFQIRFSGTTDFFGAASATTRMLASIEIRPMSSFFTSRETRDFLRNVSATLEELNVATALSLEAGKIPTEGLNDYLISMEQTKVQELLDQLGETSPEIYARVTSEVNSLLNAAPGSAAGYSGSFYGSDAAYQDVLSGVREDLGRDIDFTNQTDREMIGSALVEKVKEIRGARPKGWSGCDAAGCTWNDKKDEDEENGKN